MPTMPAERRRLANRAAGVGAKRDERLPRRHRRCRAPDDPPGTRSAAHGLCVGKNAEFSVDDPIANSSMLDLPTNTAPASNNLLRRRAVYGGTKFSEHVGRAGRGDSMRAHIVLEHERDTGERRGIAITDSTVCILRRASGLFLCHSHEAANLRLNCPQCDSAPHQ